MWKILTRFQQKRLNFSSHYTLDNPSLHMNENFLKNLKFQHELPDSVIQIHLRVFQNENRPIDKFRNPHSEHRKREAFAKGNKWNILECTIRNNVHVYPNVGTQFASIIVDTESAIETRITIGCKSTANNWPGTKCASEMRRDAFRDKRGLSIRELLDCDRYYPNGRRKSVDIIVEYVKKIKKNTSDCKLWK